MTKLNRVLLGVLVLQLGVLAGTRLLSGSSQIVKPKPLFPQLDSEKIVDLKIADDERAVELAKRDGKWVLASGGDYPAQQSKVKEFVSKLPGLTASQPVATKAEHYHALQVAADDFQRKVTLKSKDGKTQQFYLGSSPGLNKVHFRQADEQAVYSISGLSTWDVGASASNWIETEYLKLDRDKVVSLSLSNSYGQIQLLKGSDGKWTLAGAPAKGKIKQSSVDMLLSSATSVHLDEPIGKSMEPKFGLSQPQATLDVVVAEDVDATKAGGDQSADDSAAAQTSGAGSTAKTAEVSSTKGTASSQQTYVLKVGAKDGDKYYAKSDRSPFVVKLATWVAEVFINKKPSDMLEMPDDKQQPPKAKRSHSPVAHSG